MEHDNYSKAAHKIKRKLSEYTYQSLIDSTIKNFKCKNEIFISSYPWCHLLLIKWKSANKSSGNKEMSPSRMMALASEVFLLQDLIFEKHNDIDLQVRKLLNPQLVFQRSQKELLYSLARQHVWFVEYGDIYFNEEFSKITAISLDDYFGISISLLMLLYETPFESIEFNIASLITKLHPRFSLESIKSFVSLCCTNINELSLFLNSFNHSNNPGREHTLLVI